MAECVSVSPHVCTHMALYYVFTKCSNGLLLARVILSFLAISQQILWRGKKGVVGGCWDGGTDRARSVLSRETSLWFHNEARLSAGLVSPTPLLWQQRHH